MMKGRLYYLNTLKMEKYQREEVGYYWHIREDK